VRELHGRGRHAPTPSVRPNLLFVEREQHLSILGVERGAGDVLGVAEYQALPLVKLVDYQGHAHNHSESRALLAAKRRSQSDAAPTQTSRELAKRSRNSPARLLARPAQTRKPSCLSPSRPGDRPRALGSESPASLPQASCSQAIVPSSATAPRIAGACVRRQRPRGDGIRLGLGLGQAGPHTSLRHAPATSSPQSGIN